MAGYRSKQPLTAGNDPSLADDLAQCHIYSARITLLAHLEGCGINEDEGQFALAMCTAHLAECQASASARVQPLTLDYRQLNGQRWRALVIACGGGC